MTTVVHGHHGRVGRDGDGTIGPHDEGCGCGGSSDHTPITILYVGVLLSWCAPDYMLWWPSLDRNDGNILRLAMHLGSSRNLLLRHHDMIGWYSMLNMLLGIMILGISVGAWSGGIDVINSLLLGDSVVDLLLSPIILSMIRLRRSLGLMMVVNLLLRIVV